MALEKLRIIVEPGSREETSFSVLFNPSQITLDKSAVWNTPPVAASNAAEAQFERGNPYTLALDLFFDTYERGSDVRDHTQQVANLLMIRGAATQPPRCHLAWGLHNFNGYLWVLERLSQRFTFFLPNGTPVRATLSCSFKQSQSAADEKQERLTSQVPKLHTVLTGESLASIAAEAYNDPFLWKDIAEANGIDNPRRVAPGTVLLIPVIGLVPGSKKNSTHTGEATGQPAEYTVKINDKTLNDETVAVVSIMACRDVEAPGVFELRLNNRSKADRAIIFSDDERFAVGNKVEIEMGKTPQRVMAGEITSLSLDFRSGDEILTVRGHDRSHRLLRGRKTRTFLAIKDSEIASQVAKDAKLEAKVKDTQEKLPYVLQCNQTDWEFLHQRARDLGFEVLVDDKTLLFQPHQNDGPEVITLTREDQDLLEFRPRLSTIGLAGEVVVQGWSSKDKEAITGKTPAGTAGTPMGGSRSGLATAVNAFEAAVATLVDRPVFSQTEADQIAQARSREMALSYVTGDGLALGRADLKAGTVIKIDGFGKQFSGLYYLSSVCHTYSPGHGYRTAFTVRRNAT